MGLADVVDWSIFNVDAKIVNNKTKTALVILFCIFYSYYKLIKAKINLSINNSSLD